MSAVTKEEVVEALLDADTPKSVALAKYVEQHGIAPPDGMVLVPKEPSFAMREAGNIALDKLKSDSTRQCADKAFYVYHAMLGAAEGKFIEQADEETHRRVDDAVRAGRIFDKRFRGGFVSVPAEPTQEMIDAGIMFGTSPTKVSIIWSNMLAAAPEVKP